MGRNDARPAGYRPALQLYLRRELEGGGLLVPGELRGSIGAIGRRSCLVLVHGFNNTDSEAAAAYFAFRARQTEINEPPTAATLDDYFADGFWPGDAKFWSIFDKADALVYPLSVNTAREAASEVAKVLWRMPNLERVAFIGHSLGCRVVMETLLALRARPLPRVERVCLMAAALPSEMLEPGGRFFAMTRAMEGEGTRFLVLRSMNDTVLHFAFPFGQQAAGEPSSRALGRFGATALMPGFGGALRDELVEGAAHSEYWGNVASGASRKATELAGMFLELGGLPREVAVRRERIGRRALPNRRELGDT